MWFVLHHKNYVGRNVCRRLIPFFRKCYFCSLFPPFFNLYLQDFIFCTCSSPIWVQTFTGDLHPLSATIQNLLQGNLEVVYQGRVLLFLHNTTVSAQASHARAEGAREATHPATPHPKASEGVVRVHILIHASITATKELPKRVTPAEEFLKDGMRVTLESVAEGARTTRAGGSSAF